MVLPKQPNAEMCDIVKKKCWCWECKVGMDKLDEHPMEELH
jgi:hypothetical protein